MSVKVWDPAIALPKDLDDALQLIEQLTTFEEKPNPKFLALAQALLADSAYENHWVADRVLDGAKNCTSAIWEPCIPPGDGMPAIRAVIEHATTLGLVAYRESRNAVFLPGGGTVTPMQKALHDGDFEDYDSRLNARAEVCQALLKGVTKQFAQLGFLPGNLESKKHRFADLSFYDNYIGEFSRPIHDGWQRITVDVNECDAGSEYFKCSVGVGIRNEMVETIFSQVFGDGIRRMDTFFFTADHFLSEPANGFAVTNDVQVREFPALAESLVRPVLDLACDLAGLDRVMNDSSLFPFSKTYHPLSPQNLADNFVSFGRKECIKTLIVAWLVHNPKFEARVASLREFVKPRADVSEADIDKLLAHLRTVPR